MSQKTDYVYFKENCAHFFKEYGCRFIAIKNKQVLGVYDNFETALKETLKTEDAGTFIIQESTEDIETQTQFFQYNVAPVMLEVH